MTTAEVKKLAERQLERRALDVSSAPVCEWGDLRLEARLWQHIYPEPNTACWLWGKSCAGNGYGTARIKSNGQWKTYLIHRYVYQTLVGSVLTGLDLDHLCRVRSCCRPDHLEAVTRSENQRRGIGARVAQMTAAQRETCAVGHELTPANTYIPHGKPSQRRCKQCGLDAQQARRQAAPSYSGPRRPPLSTEEVAQIKAALLVGRSQCEIARDSGRSRRTVFLILSDITDQDRVIATNYDERDYAVLVAHLNAHLAEIDPTGYLRDLAARAVKA